MNTKASSTLTIKRVTPASKEKKDVKTKMVEKVTPRNKSSLIETVISNREVKYIYPDDIIDTLSRKSWRQQVRNDLNKLELKMLKIKDENSKEFKAAKKAYEEFRKKVVKI